MAMNETTLIRLSSFEDVKQINETIELLVNPSSAYLCIYKKGIVECIPDPEAWEFEEGEGERKSVFKLTIKGRFIPQGQPSGIFLKINMLKENNQVRLSLQQVDDLEVITAGDIREWRSDRFKTVSQALSVVLLSLQRSQDRLKKEQERAERMRDAVELAEKEERVPGGTDRPGRKEIKARKTSGPYVTTAEAEIDNIDQLFLEAVEEEVGLITYDNLSKILMYARANVTCSIPVSALYRKLKFVIIPPARYDVTMRIGGSSKEDGEIHKDFHLRINGQALEMHFMFEPGRNFLYLNISYRHNNVLYSFQPPPKSELPSPKTPKELLILGIENLIYQFFIKFNLRYL